jgi:hypothetical protein
MIKQMIKIGRMIGRKGRWSVILAAAGRRLDNTEQAHREEVDFLF